MESNFNNNKFDFNIESSNENIINEKLETKWKEIEEITQQKINKNKESRKLNKLNNFSIMRINLNSLIHQKDTSSEFENYCNLKITQLDKQLKELEYNSKYNSNLLSFTSNNNNRKYNNDNNIKSFLKSDDGDLEDQLQSNNNYKKYTLDEIIEMNKKNKIKKKSDFNKILDNTLNNTNEIYTNKTFTYNSKNKFDFDEDTYDKKFNIFEIKLNEIKNTFLKRDKDYITTGNNLLSTNKRKRNSHSNNKYKQDFQNDYNFTGYNTTKNKTINNISIKNKIKDRYNYLYSLYPNLKKSK